MNRIFAALVLASLSPLAGCSSAPSASEDVATDRQEVTADVHTHRCYADDDCTESQFCDTEAKATCGSEGVCKTRGESHACPYIDERLCGCDGAVYPNACLAHKAGVSIDPTPFKDTTITAATLDAQPWMDAAETHFYLFTSSHRHGTTHGTFQERTEPPCTRSTPHCDLAVAPQNGTFQLDGSTVELDYDNGNVAYFAATSDCNDTWQLQGNDFSESLTLTFSTITP